MSKGIRILKATDAPESISNETGIFRNNVELVLSQEDVERIRLGYVCLRCLEPQNQSFPIRCSLCGYQMKDRQPYEFGINHGGTQKLGPSTTLDEEQDRLDDWHERRVHVQGGQILVPSSFKVKGKKVKTTGRLHRF